MKCLPSKISGYGEFLLFVLITTLFLSGCGYKEIGLVPDETETIRLQQQFSSYINDLGLCSNGFDGTFVLEYRSPLSNKTSISGYFRTLLPSSLLISILTPLNQPIFALSANGTSFQSLDVSKRLYRAGSISSFTLKHDLPRSLLDRELGSWIAGRPSSGLSEVKAINWDTQDRGAWFTMVEGSKSDLPGERLLLDIDQQRIIKRQVLAEDGKQLAVLSYDKWQETGRCSQPLAITISEFSLNAEAALVLSDLKENMLQKEDFRLSVPSGYRRQFMP